MSVANALAQVEFSPKKAANFVQTVRCGIESRDIFMYSQYNHMYIKLIPPRWKFLQN